MASADPVATAILANDNDEGVAKFEGWLAGPYGTRFRLFTSPQFMEYIEVEEDDIVSQVQNTLMRPTMGSTIWVKREAKVVRCQKGYAEYFEDLAAGASSDDPAAARYPPRG